MHIDGNHQHKREQFNKLYPELANNIEIVFPVLLAFSHTDKVVFASVLSVCQLLFEHFVFNSNSNSFNDFCFVSNQPNCHLIIKNEF